jgi:hypothetical protein
MPKEKKERKTKRYGVWYCQNVEGKMKKGNPKKSGKTQVQKLIEELKRKPESSIWISLKAYKLKDHEELSKLLEGSGIDIYGIAVPDAVMVGYYPENKQ